MDKQSLRIVFMGTPEFAVETLRYLTEGGYNIAGVITVPDKPMGRGYKLQASPVKEYALSRNLPVLQPEKLKDPEFLTALAEWKADLQIVVAFRMLPEVVWDMPRYGTFNLHASLLPQYRGAAPINWAIMNGETETGVTTFFLTHGIDMGLVIDRKRIPIGETDNAEAIHDRLMQVGASLVVETVDRILNQTVQPVDQATLSLPSEELKPAPKIFKETCRINWDQDIKPIYDFIRGLSPYPAAWTELTVAGGETILLKVFESEKRASLHSVPTGTIISDGRTYLEVAACDGFIRLLSVQQANKKRMPVTEYLKGNGYLFLNNF